MEDIFKAYEEMRPFTPSYWRFKLYSHQLGSEKRETYETIDGVLYCITQKRYHCFNYLYAALNNMLCNVQGVIIRPDSTRESFERTLNCIDTQYVYFKEFNHEATYNVGLSFLYEDDAFLLQRLLHNNISVHFATENKSYVVDYQKSTGCLDVVYAPVARLYRGDFQFPHVTEFRIKAKYVVLYDDFLDIFPNLKTFIIQTNGRGLCRDRVNAIATKYNVSIVVRVC